MAIYYIHFGISEIRERKRRYACHLLSKKTTDLRRCAEMIPACATIDKVCFLLKQLGERLDGHLPEPPLRTLLSSRRLNTMYRNHIYPAEIETTTSAFYNANVRLIDAILIDRDPSPQEHHRARGGRWRPILKFSPLK